MVTFNTMETSRFLKLLFSEEQLERVSRFLFDGRSGERSASSAHAVAKFLAFFGGHVLPAFHHPATPSPVAVRTATEPAKKNFAENQQSQGLPVGDDMPAEQGGA